MKKRRLFKMISAVLALFLLASCTHKNSGSLSSALTENENQNVISSEISKDETSSQPSSLSKPSKDETSSQPTVSNKPSNDETSSQKDNSSVVSKNSQTIVSNTTANREEPFEDEVNKIFKSIYIMDGKRYGRVISSADSLEDAVRVATRHFTDNRDAPYTKNTVVECRVIYESDILYGVYVKWKVRNSEYEENVVSFKKSAADITVRNVIYGDVPSYKIHTNNDEEITQIVLRLCHDEHLSHMYDYEVSSTDDSYTITTRYYEVSYGDWGLSDTYKYFKQTIKVNKANDTVEIQDPIKTGRIYK